MSHIRIVLTGGPGGGKSTLIDELSVDTAFAGRLVVLPEAILTMRDAGISPCERQFQQAVVRCQLELEEAVDEAPGSDDGQILVCHRGSLDPLAYWRQRGWPPDEFFELTATTPAGHYARYAAVIHLVTAADRAPTAYERWPDAHRPESLAEAIALDSWLREAWGDHPRYHRIDNASRGWAAKSLAARDVLARYL